MIYETTTNIVIDEEVRKWCILPYPGHPKGCPNYSKKSGCPPQAPLVWEYFDLHKSHYFVVVPFSLVSHAQRMQMKHPEWSDRQARCVLYWQAGVNKALKEECQLFVRQGYGPTYNICPEAMGVNVIETCKIIGLPIEVKPINIVFKVAMLGYRRE